MTNEQRDEQYEVVWAGGEGLVPPRETKFIGIWEAPPRIYNKTGKHSKKTKQAPEAEICKECGGFAYKCVLYGHIRIEVDDEE